MNEQPEICDCCCKKTAELTLVIERADGTWYADDEGHVPGPWDLWLCFDCCVERLGEL